MSWPKRIFAAIFILAIAAIAAQSLKGKKDPPLSAHAVAVKRGSITRKVSAAGKLQAATQVKVSSNVSGDLLELTVDEGSVVKKGQLIAKIDSRRYVAQLKQQAALKAEAEAELAQSTVQLQRLKADLDRVKRLVQSQSASQADLEHAELDVAAEEARGQSARQKIEQASGALAEAEHQLNLTTIYAPIDGVVTERDKQVGERVRGSDLSEDVIVVVSTLASMEAKVEVGEHEVVYIHEGDKAEIEIDSIPDKKFPATVVEVAKKANVRNPGSDSEVTTYPTRLALDAPVPGALPGMSAEAGVFTDTHDNALIVPIQAVTTRTERELNPDGGAAATPVMETQLQIPSGQPNAKKTTHEPFQKVVFAVTDGTAHLRRVETGLASENEIEILSGVKEGETIVDGPYKTLAKELADGKAVKIEGTTPTPPSSAPTSGS
jgi:HlyD family secretion protein